MLTSLMLTEKKVLQVHKAVMTIEGVRRVVAVKVRHPNVADIIRRDFQACTHIQTDLCMLCSVVMLQAVGARVVVCMLLPVCMRVLQPIPSAVKQSLVVQIAVH